ncbi:MAG: hypothetical protein ACTHJ5_05410 [Ilyomonas sp.]
MLEGIIVLLIALLVFSFTPFAGSLLLPAFFRIITLCSLVIFLTVITVTKKPLIYLTTLVIVGILSFIWWSEAQEAIPNIFYLFAFILFALALLYAEPRLPKLSFLLSRFLFFTVITTSVQSILAFIVYNLDLLPFTTVNLGDLAFYIYAYNPFVGYIHPREFGSAIIGRPMSYMFEPSYLGWFLATNFFLIDKYCKTKGFYPAFFKVIVFAGAMATFSTGVWIVFAIIFILKGIDKISSLFNFKRKWINLLTILLLTSFAVLVFFIPKDKIANNLASSWGDRNVRMQMSLLILATSSTNQLLLGHSPGFFDVKNETGKAESNQYLRTIVEVGFIPTIVIVAFIIYCTRKNKYYMLANLLFLASVVILWTPLFIINILVCKWLDET